MSETEKSKLNYNFGVLIVTHGALSRGLRSASNMIIGKQFIPVVGLYPGHDLSLFEEEINEKLDDQIERFGSCLVLTDLFFGTPFNVVSRLMEEYDFHHYTGINLPLLIEILSLRTSSSLESVITFLEDHLSTTFIHVNDIAEEGGDL